MYRFARVEVTKQFGKIVKERVFVLYEGSLEGLLKKLKDKKYPSIYRYSFEIHYRFFLETEYGWETVSDPRYLKLLDS